MRTTFSRKSLLLAATVAALSLSPAHAQDEGSSETDPPSSGFSVSGNAAVTSDYRFRGIAQSGGDFAIQGGIDLEHDSGFYVGTWGSSVNFAGGTEIDVYGGWSGDLGGGISADVGLLYFIYPEAGIVTGPTDFFEPYASISGTLGPVEATLGAAYAWGGQNALADEDNLYIYTDLGVGIPNTPVTLNGHLGYSKGNSFLSTLQGTDNDYVDWAIGADYAITDKLTASVKYTDTDDKPSQEDFTDAGIIFTLAIEF